VVGAIDLVGSMDDDGRAVGKVEVVGSDEDEDVGKADGKESSQIGTAQYLTHHSAKHHARSGITRFGLRQ